jgi:hypothetical protein
MGRTFYDIGHAIVADDRRDIGQFGRFHHWHVGTFMMLLGGICQKVAEAKTNYADRQLLKPNTGYLRI